MSVSSQVPGKERVRGPNLAVFVKKINAIPMEEALRRTDEANLVMVSNKRMNPSLLGTDERKHIRQVLPCWTGTMAAYEKPGQKLGKTIDYVDSETRIRYLFPVPEEHVGKENILLVAEHPNFTLVKDGNDRIVQAIEVGAVERFPTLQEGWFHSDPKHDIPQGDKINNDQRVAYGDKNARYFWRIEKRVGLVVRAHSYGDWDYSDWRDVSLAHAPSEPFGMAIEAAEPNKYVQLLARATGASPMGIDTLVRSAQLEAGISAARSKSGEEPAKELTVREEVGRLIVEGTPDQLGAVARFFEGLKNQKS